MPKIVDHDERREHIVSALYALLAREGFERLNMREIAREAGYSHGAIARYFPNKQAVLKATFSRMIEGWQDQFQHATEDLQGLQGLEALCRRLWPIGATGHGNANVVVALWNEAITDEELHQIQRDNNSLTRSRIRQFLVEAKDKSEVSPNMDIEATVRSIMVRSMGWQMLAVLTSDEATDEVLNGDIQALVTGLQASTPDQDPADIFGAPAAESSIGRELRHESPLQAH